MNVRPLFLVLLPLALSFAGCAQRVAFHPPDAQLNSQLAHIPWDDARREIDVLALDGQPVGNPRAHIEMLPGTRTVQVMYKPAKTLKSYPVRVTFPAEPGHNYVFSAKLLSGQVEPDGVWGGHYEISVLDLNAAREVGRSGGSSSGLDSVGELRPPAPGRDVDYR